ncbi:hypothetical protein RGCCGE502_17240 [Rhizobium grahamii CCGE 502]|uniref:Uncharacterized protein n=1 Tax=Rhizobium grahamii CCGE 502 TaxID=990285 RepID=S3HE49_9HYPH|nr:hypothetical protein RGCCGE502_17240 [Rhizobium grahamii CCGE 502]
MRYAVVLGRDVCLVTRHLAAAETEREFFSARFGRPANVITIDDDSGATARLPRQLAVRNARREIDLVELTA